jgi:hypothetical protein
MLALAAMASAQTVSADRASIGGSKLRPDSDTVARIAGMPSGSGDVVVADASGDLRLSSNYTRDDIAEVITQAWAFNAGLSVGGNLTFTGNARRILADFSTATVANRTMFQTSTTDGNTMVYSIPNGTGTIASFTTANNATPTNASLTQLLVTSTESSLRAAVAGSGSYLPLTFYTNNAEQMRIDTAGTLQSDDFASQVTGWAVTAAGAADFRYLFVDEMHAKAFIADLEMALNGGQIIAKSTAIVAQAFTCPAAGGTATLWVKDFPGFLNIRVFAASDWVVLRTFSRTDGDNDGNTDLTIGDCVGQVSSYTDGTSGNEGSQSWTFTRGSGGSAGGMASSTVVAADSLAVDFGVSGQGFLVASANDGAEGVNSPFWQVVTWTTAPVAANMTIATRWGQLNGSYGVASSTYGFAAGSPSDANILVTGSAVKLRDGTTDKIVLDGSTGDLDLSGDLNLISGGGVYSSGNYELSAANGLRLQQHSAPDTDPGTKGVKWASGPTLFTWSSNFVANAGTTDWVSGGNAIRMTLHPAENVVYDEPAMRISVLSESGSTTWTPLGTDGEFARSSTLLPFADNTYTIGNSGLRYININLNLPNNTSPSYVVVNKGGGGGDAGSALGYISGFSGTKVAGSCTFTILVGLITNVTGC